MKSNNNSLQRESPALRAMLSREKKKLRFVFTSVFFFRLWFFEVHNLTFSVCLSSFQGEATHRACVLAHTVNCPLYIVHVMSKSAADAVVRARAAGWLREKRERRPHLDTQFFGQAGMCMENLLRLGWGQMGSHCWHHEWRHAAAFVMGPPLRYCYVYFFSLSGFIFALIDVSIAEKLGLVISFCTHFSFTQK